MFRNQKYLPQVKGSKTQQMVSMSFVGLMFRPWASFSCRSATGRTLRPDIAPAIKRVVCRFVLGTAEAQQATVVRVLEGARPITGDGGVAITDAVSIVVNGELAAVGRRGQITVPAGAVRADLRGKAVMPALVDGLKNLAA